MAKVSSKDCKVRKVSLFRWAKVRNAHRLARETLLGSSISAGKLYSTSKPCRGRSNRVVALRAYFAQQSCLKQTISESSRLARQQQLSPPL